MKLYWKKPQKIAHIGHWNIVAGTNKVTGSKELFKIFGLSEEESFIENFIETIHPKDRNISEIFLKKAVEKGEGWDVEFRIIRKDGEKSGFTVYVK